jgi:large subunit ribosomal protein L3
MAIGLVGRKCGMTRVFTEDGASVPVTVIECPPNRVTRVKSGDSDGYAALQVTMGTKRQSLVGKPQGGLYAKVGVEPGEGLWEFRADEADLVAYQAGGELTVELFQAGQMVDVTGTSIGKGYAGTIKRHNFAGQDATHGNSLSHRVPGSIGQRQTPGRVFKGKRMSGHMGNVRRTILNLEVVRVDPERNLLLVKGAVPGNSGGHLLVKPAVKARAVNGQAVK